MCFLPTPPVECPLCHQVVSLYPEPDQLRRRACGHWVDLDPERGTVGATRDLGATALLLARAAGDAGAERWERWSAGVLAA